MPILGKTDTVTAQETVTLDVVGRVWVGDAKTDNSAGRTLNDKFRIECNDRTRAIFEERYGSDRPDRLNIFLPYATPDECYHTWYESYTAQGFQHRCNGERIVQKMCQTPYKGLKGEQKISFERKDVNEPCLKGDDPECATCGKGSGRFFFYVRELYAAGMGATKAWMMSVSGAHNLTGLHAQLCALYKQYGALDVSPVPSPWTYGFIPYTLTRVEKKIMRPNQSKSTVNGITGWHQDGTRSKGSYWALSLSEDAEWLATLQKFMAIKEVQKLGGGADAIALIGGNIPLLQGYQETSIWGQTERQIRNATSTLQIASAIDVVRDEVSQGNLPADAITEAESLANSFQPVTKPIAKPKEAVQPAAEIDSSRQPLYEEIGAIVQALNWSKKRASTELQLQYEGKTTRDDLNNDELKDFVEHLRSLLLVEEKAAEESAIELEVMPDDYPDFELEA